nr:unnamed protein product [Digitaria exilis]
MAMRVISLLPAAISFMIAVASLGAHARVGDEARALLAFKAELAGSSSGVLASWNNGSTGVCGWEGVACSSGGKVVALSLSSYGLAGTLSPDIGNLTIGRLVSLKTLELSYNTFSGALPANLSSCTSLSLLGLGHNQFHGNVPVELGHRLTGLRRGNPRITWEHLIPETP